MHKNILIFIILLICPIIFGCSSTSHRQTLLDENWGRSFETARFHQTVNPDAPINIDPVTILDGKAAMNNLDQYQDSFKKKSKKPVVNINLSGMGVK